MTFADAIGLRRGDALALVGAGGKTTLSLLLALELLARGEPVACCATTMTLLPAPDTRIRTIFTAREDAAQAVRDTRQAGQLPWIAGEPSTERDPAPEARGEVVCPVALTDAKVRGADVEEIDRLHAALPDVTLIVEADGARHRWLKAPAEHEPQLPRCITILAPVAHLGIIGKPLISEFVHRPEQVARILGVPIGATLTADRVAEVLAHPEGGLKGWREGMRVAPILTLPSPDISAEATARALLQHSAIDRVVLAWLGAAPWTRAIHRRVAGILLAAGGSVRLGSPKQLLPFGGKTLVERALDTLLRSPVDEVIVVLGAHADEIAPLLRGPRVRAVVNPAWEQGQSASLRAAIHALPPDCDAVVFLPCDMPFVTPKVIAELIRSWQQTGQPIVVAASGEKRGIPALFARETFAELRATSGDQGGRRLLQKHPDWVVAVPVPAQVLGDIDTINDYHEALHRLELDR